MLPHSHSGINETAELCEELRTWEDTMAHATIDLPDFGRFSGASVPDEAVLGGAPFVLKTGSPSGPGPESRTLRAELSEIRVDRAELQRENERLQMLLSELREKLASTRVRLQEEPHSELDFEQIIGRSSALKQTLALVEKVASSDATVLLLGETGTGKELIARALHDHSRRKDRAFVKLNCAAIPTGLLESELFGHEKGAFTGAIAQKIGRFELAHEGTLFLDEVGDIPLEIQPKLLRALQEREFERLGSVHTRKANVRLIAATNCHLEKMVAAREFRSDLYYRLNVFPIRIPPLRERKEDIPLLVRFFVQKFSKQMQKQIEVIPNSVMSGLQAWDWPGNIRELENFIERAVILTRGETLEPPMEELRKTEWATQPTSRGVPEQGEIAQIVRETVAELNGNHVRDEHAQQEREQIIRILTECKGRVSGELGAAARLAIKRTTLISRMRKLGIDPRRFKLHLVDFGA